MGEMLDKEKLIKLLDALNAEAIENQRGINVMQKPKTWGELNGIILTTEHLKNFINGETKNVEGIKGKQLPTLNKMNLIDVIQNINKKG